MYLIQTVSSTPVGRRSAGMLDEPVENPDEGRKKWSIGKLFRRKKKETDSECSSGSSDEHSQKHKVKKKKSSSKKRSSTPRSNDNVNSQSKRSQSVTKIPQKEYYDDGVLSDPSAGFVGYVGRGIPRSPLDYYRYKGQDSFDKRGAGSSCGSQDGSLRKGRKGRIKARAEAKRLFKNDSSSDEESQKSTTSSVTRFRSNDSLTNNHSKENKRSRSARNDRYIKRLSRDDEYQGYKDVPQGGTNGYSRTEADILAINKGLSHRIITSPPISNSYGKLPVEGEYSEVVKNAHPYDARKSFSGTHLSGHGNVYYNLKELADTKRQPHLSVSNSSMYSYPAGVINFNAQVNDENISYCVPYNVNSNMKTENPSNKPNMRRSTSVEHTDHMYQQYGGPNYENEVMVVKLPLGNPIKNNVAPPPPPRDPQRKVSTPISYMYENTRPLSGSFDPSNHRTSKPAAVASNQGNNIYENGTSITRQMNGLSYNKRPISSSEDHIAAQQYFSSLSNVNQNVQQARPSSVSGEIKSDIYNRYINRPPINQVTPPRRHTQENNVSSEFVYFADRTPRSRRPIHIAPTSTENEQIYANGSRETTSQPRSASDFWKKLDNQECQRRKLGHNRTLSDQSITSNKNTKQLPFLQHPTKTQNASVQTSLTNNYKKVNSLKQDDYQHLYNNDVNVRKVNKENEPVCYSNIDVIPLDDIRAKSRGSEDSSTKRKSSNLEDALSELEAIYNSLGLGDEDLLDRAERQESLAPKTQESNSNIDTSDDARQRLSISEKKSVPDKVHDDMAYRRLNPHERPKSKEVNNLVSQMSYMLASPMLSDTITSDNKKSTEDEPDIVFDDVAYRNIKQANNYLKIEDPQPPFGIPIGPISPAPNSDYLHIIPENKVRSRFVPHPSPDVVSDDLAFRALRKDCKTVSPINRELTGSIHNNNSDNANLSRPSKVFDNHVIKKKRAIRSLSANIFTLIQKEIDDALNMCNEQGIEKSQSIPDLPEAIIEYGKKEKINENQLKLTSINAPKIVDSIVKKKVDITNNNNIISPSKVNAELRKDFFKTPNSNCFTENNYSNYAKNNVQDDLDIMAEEAKKTSAKLVIALEELQKERENNQLKKEEPQFRLGHAYNKPTLPNNNNSISEITLYKDDPQSQNVRGEVQKENEILKDIPKKLDLSSHILYSPTNIKVKGSIPTHIKEKMEEFSKSKKDENVSNQISGNNNEEENQFRMNVDEFSNKSKGESTEDSLIAISNQLSIVGSAIKTNCEPKCDILAEEGEKLKELAKKCAVHIGDDFNLNSEIFDRESKSSVNVQHFEKVRDVNINKNDCLSPESKLSYMKEIESLKSFDDLHKGINELLSGIGQVSDKLMKDESENKYKSHNMPVHTNKTQIETDIEKCESGKSDRNIEEEKRGSRESPEYNSSEELAMIFHLNEDSSKPSTSKQDFKKIDDSHAELNSPRLVQNANQSLRKMSLDEGVNSQVKTTQSSNQPLTSNDELPWRKFRRNSTTDNLNKGTHSEVSPSKCPSWYRDPNTLMLTCSYSLLCAQQLAGLDYLTVLGIILAMISIIAMILI